MNDCFQSCNKSLINQACSGPYWENIGPRSSMSVLSRPRADILPVRPSRLVNKIYVLYCIVSYRIVSCCIVLYEHEDELRYENEYEDDVDNDEI